MSNLREAEEVNMIRILDIFGRSQDKDGKAAKEVMGEMRDNLRQCLAYYRQVHGFPKRETDVQVDEKLVERWKDEPIEAKRIIARVRFDTYLRHITWSLEIIKKSFMDEKVEEKVDAAAAAAAEANAGDNTFDDSEEEWERILAECGRQTVEEHPEFFGKIDGLKNDLILQIGDHVKAGRDIPDDSMLQPDHELWALAWERGPNRWYPGYSQKMWAKFGIEKGPLKASDEAFRPFRPVKYSWGYADESYELWLNWKGNGKFTWEKMGIR